MEVDDKMNKNIPLLILSFAIAIGLYWFVDSNTQKLISQTNEIIKRCEKP